jgi:serine/threonine protein kinase
MQPKETNANTSVKASPSSYNGRRYKSGEIIREVNEKNPKNKIFLVLSCLATGSFSDVYEVYIPELKNKMACKLISKLRLTRKPLEREMTREEIRIHIKIFKELGGHRNIVRPLYVTKTQDHVMIGTELCRCDSLNELARREYLSTSQVISYFRQMVEAVSFLHNNGIVHRDVKLANALLAKDGVTVKLCDFGFAWEEGTPDVNNGRPLGTMNYLAPEILRGGVTNSKKGDIWALGCCLYALFNRSPPFEKEVEDIKGCKGRILSNQWEFTERFNSVPTEAVDLIMRCLSLKPDERPTCEEILKHPLFSISIPPLIGTASTNVQQGPESSSTQPSATSITGISIGNKRKQRDNDDKTNEETSSCSKRKRQSP